MLKRPHRNWAFSLLSSGPRHQALSFFFPSVSRTTGLLGRPLLLRRGPRCVVTAAPTAPPPRINYRDCGALLRVANLLGMFLLDCWSFIFLLFSLKMILGVRLAVFRSCCIQTELQAVAHNDFLLALDYKSPLKTCPKKID